MVTLLKDAELPHRDAWEVWHHGFDGGEESVRPAERGNGPEEVFLHSVQENIHLLKQREQNSSLKNPAGFLLIAIKHNYTNAHREQDVTRQEKQQQADKRGKLAHTKDQFLSAHIGGAIGTIAANPCRLARASPRPPARLVLRSG